MRFAGRRRPQIGAAAVGQKLRVKSASEVEVWKGLKEKASSCDVTECDGNECCDCGVDNPKSLHPARLIQSDVRTTGIDSSGCDGRILRRLLAG